MGVLQFPEVAQVPSTGEYRDPVVRDFYSQAIEVLEKAPDGASAATAIAGLFHIHHHSWQIREVSYQTDIRRLSSDDSAKLAMLAHTSRSVGRALEETTRLVGLLHRHEAVESRMADIATQLEATNPDAAADIRQALETAAQPAPPAVGTVVISSAVDPRWRCGWFKQDDSEALKALPFAGWALVADTPNTSRQYIESSFVHGGAWLTKTELAERGLVLDRMD